MKEKKFIVGTGVIVTLKNGEEIHGTIASVDTNLCTWEEEYSVNYVKYNELWTILGVPASNIKLS